MTDESWSRVKEVFHEAQELPPAGRGTFVAKACGDDLTTSIEEVREVGAAVDRELSAVREVQAITALGS